MDSIAEIVDFLKETYRSHSKTRGVIAVSGGIDSALSTTLLCQALGPEQVYPLFLPYADQSTADSKTICIWNKIPEENWSTLDIQPVVDALSDALKIEHGKLEISRQRRGNIMARVRMIAVFDRAKALDALVCGTENKSEHYLGYFTRYGDSASDIEPICDLYKTQVRAMAQALGLPRVFLDKPPSAGLWEGQTDESEMGFSYEDADKALAVILGESNEEIDSAILGQVTRVVDANSFKHLVPYILS